MPIQDASDRQQPKKPKKVRVKKNYSTPDSKPGSRPKSKPKPVPVPNVAVAYEEAPPAPKKPKPFPYAVPLAKTPKPPKGNGRKHLPRKVTYMSPEQWGAYTLLGDEGLDSHDKKQIEKYNQKKERERRARERRARFVYDPKNQLKLRDRLGEGQSRQDFILHGKRDTAGTLSGDVRGILHFLGKELGGGELGWKGIIPGQGWVSPQEAAKRGEKGWKFWTQTAPDAVVGKYNPKTRQYEGGISDKTLSEWVIGPNLEKMASGENYNPWLAGLEFAVIFTPGKGLPTLLTRLLRSSRGGVAALREFRAGLRAGQRARDAGRNAVVYGAEQAVEPIRPIERTREGISSLAGHLKAGLPHGQPKGPIWRTSTEYGSDFREPAATNPVGKAFEKAFDTLRGKVGWTAPKAGQYARKGMHVQTQTESIALTRLRAAGRRVRNPAEWKALQLMAENISPQDAFARDMANAANFADPMVRYNLMTQARLSQAASKFIWWDPILKENRWTVDASRKLKNVDSAMRQGAGYRDGTLEFYEVLTQEAMKGRVDAPARMAAEAIGLRELEENAQRERDSILHAIYKSALNDPMVAGDENKAREMALENLTRVDQQAIVWADSHNQNAAAARAVLADNLAREGREMPPVEELPPWMQDVKPSDWYKGLRVVRAGFSDDVIADELSRFPNHLLQEINDFVFNPKIEGRFAGGLRRTNLKVDEARRYAPGGDLYNPEMGLPTHAPLFVPFKGEEIQLLGPITPEEWAKRATIIWGDDLKGMDEAARWYELFDGIMRQWFGDDAEAIMRGFAVSQANASPEHGLGAVLKVLYKVRRGERVSKTEASAVVKEIEAAIKDEVVSSGMAAKLHDFADSLEGVGVRTWMGGLEDAGWPTANDVWSIRDQGYVDKKALNYLKDRFGVEVAKDSGGSPGDHQYQRMVEKYAEITDYLNKEKFGGRDDWNPSQVQALGWSTIQKLYGRNPQNFHYAILGNAHQIDTEVTQGVSNLGADLSAHEAIAVAKEMEPRLIELIDDTPDVYMVPGVTYTTGGWEGGSNGVMQFKVVGSKRAIEDLVQRIGRAFDQEWVQASRRTSSQSMDPRSAVVISSDSFKTEAEKQRFFEILGRNSPESVNTTLVARLRAYKKRLKPGSRRYIQTEKAIAEAKQKVKDLQGYASTEVNGKPAIVIRTHHASATGKKIPEFEKRYTDAILKSAKEAGIEVETSHQNLALVTGGAHGLSDPLATARGSSRRAGGVDDQLADSIRQELEQRIAAVRAAREGDQGLRSAASHGGGSEGSLDPLSRQNYATARDGSWNAKDLFYAREGAEQAAKDLNNGIIPTDFIKAVIDDPALPNVHQKAGVLQYLDRMAGGPLDSMGKERLDQIHPNLFDLVGTKRLRGEYRYNAPAGLMGQAGRHEGALTLSETQARAGTFAHEIMHYAHKQGLLDDNALAGLMRYIKKATNESELSPWTKANDEDLVGVMEVYLLHAADRPVKPRGMPKDVWEAIQNIGSWMQQDHRLSGGQNYRRTIEKFGKKRRDRVTNEEIPLMELPPEITAIFDSMYIVDRHGKYRIHYQRGLPVPIRKDLLKNRQAIANRIAYARGRDSAVGKMWDDPTTRKEFEGYLLKTGAYAADVISSNEASIAKAVRLHQTNTIRQLFIQTGKDVPDNYMWWPFKVDADLKVSPELKRAYDKLSMIDNSLNLGDIRKEVGRPRKGLRGLLFNKYDLEVTRMEQLDAWQREAFPKTIEVAGEKVTAEEAARIVMQTQTPIPNIVWVNPSLIQASHLLDVPRTLSMKKGQYGIVLSAAAKFVDALNDAMRISLLYMNPAYYGMNLMGNVALMLMHQGWATPLNLRNSVMAHWYMGDDIKNIIDNYMGEGLMSIASLRSWHGGKNSISNLANFLVDRIPRRAAWLHEARRQGLRSPDDIVGLIRRAEDRDPQARELIEYITRRAKDEMVDFDNLTPIERDIVSRIIFVYPWIKGSARWTIRFPMNHPVQASAYALLYIRQQELAGEELPERPGYLDLFFPVATVERHGEDVPYGFNPKQLIPASQPYDIGTAIWGWFTGDKSESPLSEMAQPIWTTALARLIGYDPFSDTKVERDALQIPMDILKQADVFGVGDITGLWKTEAPGAKNVRDLVAGISTEGRLYPKNELDKWLKVFLGSLAPTPVDPDLALKYAREKKGAKQTALDQIEKEEKLVGTQMSPQLRAVRAAKSRLQELYSEERKSSGKSDLDDWQITLSKARLLNEIAGRDVVGIKAFERDIKGLDSATLRKLDAALEKQMGFGTDEESIWNKAVRIAEEAEE